eukprot:CAMPEP_0178921752 /NCGR_PEP_ID=MMETSP0786-20121207/15743_1 /TAXON_ID=186022 /ORGANISM="Thalassionema frauenfeldii, Strain CCMP 1798" /LENGTH=516 /DNA_ID=CAMNT_0020595981 /DNA_START=35 /DNA_END=1585 /DNA_ORIENTATION=+
MDSTKENLHQVIHSFSKKKDDCLPSVMDFYRLGLVLYTDSPSPPKAINAYESYVQLIPRSYLSQIMLLLTEAFGEAINSSSDIASVRTATQSICGLLRFTPTTCQAAYSVVLCTKLSLAYETLQKSQEEAQLCCTLVETLHSLLLHGLLGGPTATDEQQQEELLTRSMDLVQALTEDSKNTYFGDMIISNASLLGVLENNLNNSTERDYLFQMINSSPKASDFLATGEVSMLQDEKKESNIRAEKTVVDARTEIQRRVEQVQAVLPDYGAGYIESALSHFQGDVSRTVSALCDDPSSLPPSLQLLDKKLPARKKDNATSTKDYEFDDAHAKKIAKQRLHEMEQQQEIEAHAVRALSNDEYNDDYDDQYDGLDGGDNVGGVGGTYDDVDLNTIRTYNRVAKEAEQEDRFWQESRNTNRQPAKNKDTEQGEGGKVYRGPDKIKGGRIIGPDGKVVPRQRGGKKARANNNNKAQESTDQSNDKDGGLSKIQKRRKNDNKAKIGNHHRKERAQRKANAGM